MAPAQHLVRGGRRGCRPAPVAVAGACAAVRPQVVFVKTANGLEPRVVRLGLSDFD